ncbi:MAG: ATP-binding protein [Syntrophales bacterium]|jgi:PAS domain S-box-containing protein|nr:ATP-binding protein [Syntrophales bacterium]MCK9390194.1 ATP-binding protein [Syntrophales bacterium]
MTIRTKLAINILSLVGFSLVIILVLNITSHRIDESIAKGVFADRIVIGVSDMNTITYDYVANPSERARQQWERKHASLGELINKAEFAREDKKAILKRIKENHDDAGQFFRQIIENNRKKNRAAAVASTLLDESNERNVAQLRARSQIMISDAYVLTRASYDEISKVQTWSFWLILTVILLSMLIAGAISYFLSRTINITLRTLTKGTEVIAGGDLNHRLPIKGKDEIAALSAAFNEMTAKLARSYASLGQEIAEKEKAGEALQKAHDELEDRVTERTRELSRSEQRISWILSSITDCYYALDRDWWVTEINDHALIYFGKKREEFLGRNWWDIFPAGLGSVFEEQYRKALSEGTSVEFDVHSLVVDRWAEVHAYPSENGLSVYFKDISERKKAEEALKERTTELEAANKELEDFSYTVAHDLRAPLRAIDGFSALLARLHEKNFDGDAQRKIRIVRDNVRNMNQLIDDLLTFSGLGRRTMAFSVLDMEALLKEAWHEQCVINPGRQLELRSNGLPPAFGDRASVRQVLVNLLSNAVKFTNARTTAVIEVGGRDEGRETRYFVKDNGAGFDMRHHEKLFGVFQRLHGTDEYEGTGVGLAIVQRVVHRHGGRVWGEGEIDRGATFHFTLPRKDEGSL